MENRLLNSAEAVAGEHPSINRREFLNLAWLASLGIVTLVAGGSIFFFALPRLKEGEFGSQFSISPENLPTAEDPPVGYPKGRFWLSHTEEGLSAFYMVCTHLGCLYAWLPEKGYFRCPCHGSEFHKDGSVQHSPAPRALDRFVMRVIDPNTGEVITQTDPETLAPLPVPEDPNIIISVDTGDLLRSRGK
jgi:cytochrome b6-f complex iron-sulfur subunit